jgi:hypothetical protein
MSLARLVYYSAVIGGWAAFLGWLIAECLILRGDGTRGGTLGLMLVGALVGGGVGAGINVVAGISNTQWKRVLMRIFCGLLVGAVGGGVGILLGNLIHSAGLPRALGFMVLGLGVGIVDGLYELSPSKIRNGLIGGLVGGLVGGFLFDPLTTLLASSSGISSRATAFVILGMCIGALIGLTQVVLRQAWLTVLDGYRPGRQLILSQAVTALGRGDHLPLPFIGLSNAELESEHLRIVRGSDGYTLEDNQSRLGISLNHQKVQGSQRLKDGDVIKMGSNFIRFNERRRHAGESRPAVSQPGKATPPVAAARPVAPPPPPPKAKAPPPPATPSAKPAAPAGPAAAKPPSSPPPGPAPAPRAPANRPPPPPPPGRKT